PASVLVIRPLRGLTPAGPPSLRSDVLSAAPQVNHPDNSPAGNQARKVKPEAQDIQFNTSAGTHQLTNRPHLIPAGD
ncbi:MAG: hypothetical protein PVJ66_10170, partial [Gammaproteobacteria bacterium]